MRTVPLLSLLGLGLSLGICHGAGAAQPGSLAEELKDGFYSRINVLGYDLYQDIGDSGLNPGNSLGLARNQAELQLRPDFNLKWRSLEFDLKPRFQTTHTDVSWTGAAPARQKRDHAFINEGTVRLLVGERLVLSYGRENLQWGPSSLLSPSNPFNANNGRTNPNLELPGLDYARAVWVISPSWTVSAIANTGKGRLDSANRYRKAGAVKVDYTADAAFVSLIASKADGEQARLGGYAGWNVTDALALRAEGSVGRAGAGGGAAAANPDQARRDRQLLVGASYTLEAGPTLSAEYFWNKDGCADAAIQVCLQRRGALLDPLRPLARRRYAMLQLVDTKIGGALNVYTRLTRNLDDRSMQFVLNLEYELGQHWNLYAIPTWYRGTRDSEFKSLLKRSLFVGASYTF
jgi:hypothetical protein